MVDGVRTTCLTCRAYSRLALISRSDAIMLTLTVDTAPLLRGPPSSIFPCGGDVFTGTWRSSSGPALCHCHCRPSPDHMRSHLIVTAKDELGVKESVTERYWCLLTTAACGWWVSAAVSSERSIDNIQVRGPTYSVSTSFFFFFRCPTSLANGACSNLTATQTLSAFIGDLNSFPGDATAVGSSDLKTPYGTKYRTFRSFDRIVSGNPDVEWTSML